MKPRTIIISIVILIPLALLCIAIVRFKFSYDAFARGESCFRRHNYRQAVVEFSNSLKYSHSNEETLVNRANAYDYLGDYRHALQDYSTAIYYVKEHGADDSTVGEIYFNRGVMYNHYGHYNEAIEDMRTAIQLKPSIEDANDFLAENLAVRPGATQEDGKEAVKIAMKACEQTNWNNMHALATLASAYARAGEYDKAVKWQQKALTLNTDTKVGKAYRVLLDLYKAGKPYTEMKSTKLPLELSKDVVR